MKRVVVLSFVAVLFALAPVAVDAQGLFGSGLPSFAGFLGGSSTCGTGCGDKCDGPAAGTTLYVGWMDDPNGVDATFTYDSGFFGGLTSAHHSYRLSGLWLGLTQSCPLGDNLSFLASGWYLFPSNKRSSEEYNFGQLTAFANVSDWSTKSQWWFVDGLFAFGTENAKLLAGVRYDYVTTSFDEQTGVLTDTADFTSYGIIPLFGVQYAQSGLLFRIVGVPALLGSMKYRESLFGGAQSLEGKGTYNGGYFIEAFGEYGFKMGGSADAGIFARYNVTQGKSMVNFDFLPGVNSADYRLSLYRSTWTIGGKFSLNFNIPFI
jgi:hypothetical protein